MSIQTLSLRIDFSGVAEELKDMAEVRAFEVDGGAGCYFLFHKTEQELAEQMAARYACEAVPLYRFKQSEPDPNQPGLFEEKAENGQS